ncbi:hypothetical protein Asi03nite_60910 [Actinoplanes siamensis]|uniref:Uncharacterized protein n=1 Tax=Actinoplanes siamensis TaxID=1223317 RepID=A0A919NCS7_9ACTN|nr:hypothetical protein Asi03nite_60910 [Actinoplanes siamensis]
MDAADLRQRLSATQPWPEPNYMRQTIGHKVVTGNREARALSAVVGNALPAHVEELREVLVG